MDKLATALAIIILCIATWLIYNVFLHPLRRFPGPLANRASVIPKVYHLLTGTLPFHITDIHSQYGPVVRIAPNELAFTNPQAWKDIYSRKPGAYEHPHDVAFYNATNHHPPSLLNSPREKHDITRKLLSPAFSERAMKAQEPTIDKYVSLLMQRLRENCNDQNGDSTPVNMTDWIAYTTFDLIGTLAYGSDFGCLSGGDYHPWIRLIIGTMKDMAKMHALKALGVLDVAIFFMRAFKIGEKDIRMHGELTDSKTRQRMELGTGRDDFLDDLIQSGMGVEELKETGSLLIIAGSETTATLLTGALYFLTTNQDILSKLQREVRGTFTTESEITLTTVTKLPYMLSVLKESLRCYPPVAISAPRLTPPDGAIIAGHFVPPGTTVSIYQWAAYHDANHFTDPYTFDPDRFAQPGVGKYANDKLDVVNPFLVGPRNCIGQNLAYAEMRLILARLVWGFDFGMGEKGRAWLDQKNYLFWEKGPLEMYLMPVEVR